MTYELILIRYAELSLKGKNRKKFEKKLEENIHKAISVSFPKVKIIRSFGRMFLELNGEKEEAVSEKLKHVFGIYSFSPAIKTALNETDICKGALIALEDTLASKGGSFKVTVKRINKAFPTGSQDMNKVVGGHVLRNINDLTVDVHNPDVELKVEIRDEAAYVSCKVIKGAGGLPVGTSGTVLLMLSGGIDSPVAGYLALKRGVTIEAVHFHSPPFTNERALQKVKDLTRELTEYGGKINLHIVPFTDIQTTIHKQIPDNYEMTVMRRFMLRITEKLVDLRKAKGIVNGESLGQVASQTLDSMYAINEVTTIPILRPLITMDKLDVIAYAKKIGTYDISILPYEDCCTIFLPSSSKTKPNREKTNRYESWLPIAEMVQEAIDHLHTIEISANHDSENVFEELF